MNPQNSQKNQGPFSASFRASLLALESMREVSQALPTMKHIQKTKPSGLKLSTLKKLMAEPLNDEPPTAVHSRKTEAILFRKTTSMKFKNESTAEEKETFLNLTNQVQDPVPPSVLERKLSYTIKSSGSSRHLLAGRRSIPAISRSSTQITDLLPDSAVLPTLKRPESNSSSHLQSNRLKPLEDPETGLSGQLFPISANEQSPVPYVEAMSSVFPSFKISSLKDYESFPLEKFDTTFDPKMDFDYFITTHQEGKSRWLMPDGKYIWTDCWVNEYDHKTHEFIIRWKHNLQIKRVRRLNLIFEGEKKQYFEKLRETAHIARLKHLLWLSLKSYSLHEATVPTCQVSFPSQQLERIIAK